MILAIDDEHRRPHIDRVSGLRARLGLPAESERRREFLDLLSVLVRGLALESDLVPVERGSRADVARHQTRRLRVIHVGDHEHGRGVLQKAVRHLFEAEADILEADFLGDDHQRHRRALAVGVTHDPRENCRVPHAGIEYAKRRRRRPDMLEFERGPMRDRRLLVAGIDERQVLLAVVVETERRRLLVGRRFDRRNMFGAHRLPPARPATRSFVICATCSPWNRHMPSSSAVGIRDSSPAPVILLAP